MAAFTKVVFDIENLDLHLERPEDFHRDYQTESTRVESDFTINTSKNVHKNYKRKGNKEVVVPGIEYLYIQPEDAADPEHAWYKSLEVSPTSPEVDNQNSITIRPTTSYIQEEIPQVPFVLAAKGIIFRQRGTPYFTTLGNPDNYID
tara:strand:+ start:1862 stop:2302 length:441 start_codon:yes stop_codon:yes gene_type:complete